MRTPVRIALLLAYSLAVLAAIGAAQAADRIILRPADLGGKAVELFVSAPNATHRHPGILFVHGHQEPQRPGGRAYVEIGRLDRMARAGFVAAAVSQPGYGGSEGPPDYCGPQTQRAIRAALEYLRGLPTVDRAKLILYGFSRGAIASAMVATQEPELRALIVVSGVYDMAAAYPSGNPGLDANIEAEAGTTLEAFAARSALRAADAKMLDTGHAVPVPQQWQEIDAFLSEVLRN